MSPSENWIILDEHPDSINDADFIVRVQTLLPETSWTSLPASHHGGACTIAFGDGHTQIKKWVAPTTVVPVRYVGWDTLEIRKYKTDDRRDYHWLLTHTTERIDGRPVATTPNNE